MASPAPWPSPGDYSAAIQNPHNCFVDPELNRGRATTNHLGLPIGASGNFAVVYQLQSGARMFAVRCFIRPVTNQQQRYDALSQHLRGFWLPALVDYAYLPQGIRVRGQWYPIVRMEWIAGKQMHQYIEDHLRQGQTLDRLAAQWRGVVAGMRGAHTAHGDLQHGNILADSQGQLRLVDYDGFFIPALQAHPPGEVGHPNYQHPERLQKGYYAENADAFAALVIYLSLLALRTDPSLWTLHTGENLLFLANDFTQPGHAPVWRRLQGSVDPEVRRLAAALEGFCRRPVAAVPDLETVIQGLLERVVATSSHRSSPAPSSVPSAPSPRPVSASSTVRPAHRPLLWRWGFVMAAFLLLVALGVWQQTQPTPPPQAPASPRASLQERVATLWSTRDCAKAETALQEARRQQPDVAEPYSVAITLLLQGGPCSEALGTRDPVALLTEAIRRGVAGVLPVRVEIETAYGATLTITPEHLRTLAPDRVELHDGSRYRGTIRLKKG
jgi:hypothetical protein